MIKDSENPVDARSELISKMNEENTLLHKQMNELRRKMESLNTDVLLKNQIIDDNNLKNMNEI